MFSLVLFLVAVTSGPVAGDLGALEIRTTPGAEVLWEGISLGEADARGYLLIERVPPGSYAVGARKAGFRPAETRVEVGAGAATRLSLPLQRVPPPQPARQPPPDPEPPKAVDPAPAASDEPRPEEAAPAALPEEEPTTSTPAEPRAEGEVEPADTPPVETAGGLSPALIALIALVGGLGLFLVRRRRSLQPAHREPTGRPFIPPDPKIVSSPEDDTGFIETLKEKERSLEDEEPGRPRPPEIIDAEYIELFESQEE